ncbi:MAG: M60 family metallopeptidase [Pseudomonadota bacterium]
MHPRVTAPCLVTLLTLALAPVAARAAVSALTVPPLGVTVSDQPVAFSSATFDAPGFVGTLAPTDGIQLGVSTGTLTLASTVGLFFVTGDGFDDANLLFTGSQGHVLAALDGLVYTPPEGFAGGAVITMALIGTPALQASWGVAVNAPINWIAARNAILSGFSNIHGGVQPGHMVAFGPTAYEAVRYPGANGLGTLIAFASWGAGRVIAVPDHQMLDMDSYGTLSGTFYKNGLAWLAGSPALSVKIVTLRQGTADWLTGQGYTDVTVTDEEGLYMALFAADVFVPGWLGADVSDLNLYAIGEFVLGGGGLFIADYGVGYQWWWGKPIHQAPGNLLLREAGIGFTSGYMPFTAGIAMIKTATQQINADVLLSMLEDVSSYTADDLTLGLNLLKRIFDALPPGDPLAARLDAAIEAQMAGISPTPATPVSGFWEQALLLRESILLEETPLDEIVKHRTADAVFGAVPDDAPRVTAAVMIDPAVTRWHSTGLYVAPGDLVTVDVPLGVVGEGFRIQVSGHVDDISNQDVWLRMPRVDRVFELDAAQIQVATPFGGALYVDVGTTSTDLAPFDVAFWNVVEAPLFILGETTDAAWIEGIRDLPAPYAEFVSGHLSISLPSSMIRELAEAEAVAAFWDQVVTLQDALSMVDDMRTNAERINIDVQVSWGYLHAGYPAQGPRVAGPELVDLDGLLEAGSWGWFHELGHEAQRRPDKSWAWDNAYTFDDAVEATVNIFTTTVYDVMDLPGRGSWSWTGPRVQVMKKALDGLNGGGTFATLDAGSRLAMFLQLRDGWTWGAYQALFAGYNATAPGDLPGSNPEERDQFLVRFSEIIGHDLGPFLGDAWGLALSDAARAEVAALPDWLPALGGIEGRFIVPAKTTKPFDLAGEALSFDGVAVVSDVTQPVHGILSQGGDGTWTYQAEPGFQGLDAFQYTVTSSTGHSVISTVDLDVTSHGVLMERWDDINGSLVSDLTTHPGYPDAPDATLILGTFQAPANLGSNFGARLRAFLVPQETGEYTFWIASDDNGELWLSPDQDPGSAALIASVPLWTGPEQWNLYAEQQSDLISLTAGQVYYIEALYKEGGNADHLAVAWAPASGLPTIIDGADLRIYRTNNVAPVATPDSTETLVDAPVYINVLANDGDEDGDPLYVLGWETSPGAAVTPFDDQILIYSPPAGFSGADTFTYTVADGYGGAATAQVTVWVLFDCLALLCDDGNPCTDESCDPLGGCTSGDNTLPCSDGDICTDGDACAGGLCQGGAPKSCDDGDLCTDDVCDPILGCLSGDAADCEDWDPCTDDSCEPDSGCVYAFNTAPCSDTNACTGGDACQNGACVPGTPVTCVDGDPCTTEICNPASGCTFSTIAGCCAGDLDCPLGEACQDLTCEAVHCVDCAGDEDCGNGGICFTMDSGDHCLIPCDDGCPEGAVCAGAQDPACWPFQGDCVCTPGAGEACNGDQRVSVDSCGTVEEVLEVCDLGCVEGVGCCAEGTQAVGGECLPDGVGEDLVTDPDVVIAPDVVEAEETWTAETWTEETWGEETAGTDTEPMDLAPGEDTEEPAPDVPGPPPDVPTVGSDIHGPGADGASADDDLGTDPKGRHRGCAAAPTPSPLWALLLLLAAAWVGLRSDAIRRR